MSTCQEEETDAARYRLRQQEVPGSQAVAKGVGCASCGSGRTTGTRLELQTHSRCYRLESRDCQERRSQHEGRAVNYEQQKRRDFEELTRARQAAIRQRQDQKKSLYRQQEEEEVCTACRVRGWLVEISNMCLEVQDRLGVEIEDGEVELPPVFEEVDELLDGIGGRVFAIAHDLDIDLTKEADEEEEPKHGYLVGRIEGLAGTTRYDLSDEDRAFLRELAGLLKETA
jgi:hypothetical protein